MAAALTAASLGHDVIGVDMLPAKLEMARELGATSVFTPAEIIDGGVTAPVVIEAAGNARAFEVAVAATAPGGTTVTVGLPAPGQGSTIPHWRWSPKHARSSGAIWDLRCLHATSRCTRNGGVMENCPSKS